MYERIEKCEVKRKDWNIFLFLSLSPAFLLKSAAAAAMLKRKERANGKFLCLINY